MPLSLKRIGENEVEWTGKADKINDVECLSGSRRDMWNYSDLGASRKKSIYNKTVKFKKANGQ